MSFSFLKNSNIWEIIFKIVWNQNRLSNYLIKLIQINKIVISDVGQPELYQGHVDFGPAMISFKPIHSRLLKNPEIFLKVSQKH